ncbi:MAG: TlpA family protein disulfide reductase [Ignavibacteria bacterium]|nr:TlpA family protein disulfide reductase [Ignavibacteria bacterium]
MKLILALFITVSFGFQSAGNSQELIPADKNTLDKLISENKDKVLLFNYWATWCKPCVEEFPDLMKLHKNYKDKDFKLIFVSLDFGEDFKDEIVTFLKKSGVDFDTYYNNFNKDEELLNYVDKNWEGGIPGTFIYDKTGKLRKSMVGKHDYDEFKKEVDIYLKN